MPSLAGMLHCLGCVLKVVVLLEGEPSPQSEVRALWTRFSSRISLSGILTEPICKITVRVQTDFNGKFVEQAEVTQGQTGITKKRQNQSP